MGGMVLMDIFKILEEYSKIRPDIMLDKDSIGVGGMKTVYRAKDEKRQLDLVVKTIISQGLDSEKRTNRELEILKKLDSPYFPKIYDVDELIIDNTKVIVSSETFINGVTLREYMSQSLSEKEALLIGIELLKALSLIHKERLVHRDVKPENIMVTSDQGLVLLDFGIARDLSEDSITSDLAMFGPMTLGYAAPEQISNKKRLISERTDFFSWAIVMYELLTGHNPLKKGVTGKQEVIRQTLNINELDFKLTTNNRNLARIIKKNIDRAVHKRSTNAESIISYIEKGD